jgi:hypothetical protein
MTDTPNLNRRGFLTATGAGIAASQLGLAAISKRVMAMTDVMTEAETGSETSDIRPFHNKFSDADVTELRRRVNATRWPERETRFDTHIPLKWHDAQRACSQSAGPWLSELVTARGACLVHNKLTWNDQAPQRRSG